MIHLDTSFLIHALVPSSHADRRLRAWLRAGDDLALFREIVPFTDGDSETTARFFNLEGRRRGTLADCMIAATAIRDGAALATANPGDSQRFAAESLVVVSA